MIDKIINFMQRHKIILSIIAVIIIIPMGIMIYNDYFKPPMPTWDK